MMKRHAAAIFIVVFATIGCQTAPHSEKQVSAQEDQDQDWEAHMDPSNPDIVTYR